MTIEIKVIHYTATKNKKKNYKNGTQFSLKKVIKKNSMLFTNYVQSEGLMVVFQQRFQERKACM